jgi:hypothetical protein
MAVYSKPLDALTRWPSRHRLIVALQFEYKRDVGFGTSLYITIGKLQFTWTYFEGHWYVSLMWASRINGPD